MGRKRKVHFAKEAKTADAKMYSHTDQDSNPVEAMIHSNSLLKKMKSKNANLAVRRSSRLNSSIFPRVYRPALKNVSHVEIENYVPQETKNADRYGMEAVNTENTWKAENTCIQLSNGLPPKKTKSKNANVVIRRSNRLQNSVKCNQRTKQNDLPVRNGRKLEEKAPNVEQINMPNVNDTNGNREEIEGIAGLGDEVKSKVGRGRRRNEASSADLNYRSLYIDSQKSIEALMDKHYEVVKQLEYAHGKIDAYEKMSMNMTLILMWLKDATETPSFSPAAEDDDQTAAASKRKKKTKSGKC